MKSYFELKIDVVWSFDEAAVLGAHPAIVLVDTLWASTAIATAFFRQSDRLYVRDIPTISSTNLATALPYWANRNAAVYTASFVNAEATIQNLLKNKYDQILFVPVGSYLEDGTYRKSLEDYFAAAFMVRLIEKSTGVLFKAIQIHRRLIDQRDLMIGELKSNEFVRYLLKNSKIQAVNVESSFSIDTCPVVCMFSNEETGYFYPVP